ncbi:MAG TPA: pantetheine-phosphate adenylyltransferase [Gemmatimonadaceae bacterium]|nr:pantetheine-phosphate adenylyltransferase [Gemmatimonadaceae bacterium]
MSKIAIYAGTFDPITRGHQDLITRSLAFCDRLLVVVAAAGGKQPLFTIDERIRLVRTVIGPDARVEVHPLENRLLVDFAREKGARLLIRGLRAVSDFEYEFQMALMNRHLAPIETIFMVPSLDLTYLSSSIVREVARYGGDLSDLVHPAVNDALRERFAAKK